jgi:phospholipid-binding lipoprotein MlaA
MNMKKNYGLSVLLLVSSLIGNVQAKERNFDYSSYLQESVNRCDVYDPYELFNRKIFIFNAVLDGIFLSPVARVYGRVTPEYAKNRINSAIWNLRDPISAANYGLQGNTEGAGKSLWRFVINSTLGLGGLFDVASKFDVKQDRKSFSDTLAYYGVGPGPYIVLPIMGGGNARDLVDNLILSSVKFSPIQHLHQKIITGEAVIRLIHVREKMLPFTDYVGKNSTDPYVSVRDAIIKQKEARVVYPDNFVCPKVRQKK